MIKNENLRKRLNYIPLIILAVSAVILVASAINNDAYLGLRSYTGITMLIVTTILFFKNHMWGLLSLGLLLFMGFFGLLSLTQTVVIKSYGIFGFTVIRFQPIFFIWLLIHFILSGKFYVGIGTKTYWDYVKKNKLPFEDEPD